MLMAILITTIIVGKTASTGSSFIIEDVDKLVSKAIVDPERKKESKEIFKAAENDMKSFAKAHDKQVKKIKKELETGNKNNKPLEVLLSEDLKMRQNYQSKLINYRLRLQDLLTDEEWQEVVVEGVELSNKELNRIDKSERKFGEKVQEKFEKVKESIRENVSEEAKKDKTLASFYNLEYALLDLIHELEDYNFRENSILPNQQATEGDLKGLYSEFDGLRTSIHDSLINFRNTAAENTDNDGFKKIMTAFSNCF